MAADLVGGRRHRFRLQRLPAAGVGHFDLQAVGLSSRKRRRVVGRRRGPSVLIDSCSDGADKHIVSFDKDFPSDCVLGRIFGFVDACRRTEAR